MITCTFLIVVVQEIIFHLIYMKVLILINCGVFQVLCKMCLFSQTRRLPNTKLAVKDVGSRGEWIADVLLLIKGEQGCLEEGCLWLMEQDFVRCVAWTHDTLKPLEDRRKLTCERSGSMLFGCNLKHLQSHTWDKIWNKWPGLVWDHKACHIHVRVNAPTVSLGQLHSYRVLHKPPKASEERWCRHNFPLKIHAC